MTQIPGLFCPILIPHAPEAEAFADKLQPPSPHGAHMGHLLARTRLSK